MKSGDIAATFAFGRKSAAPPNDQTRSLKHIYAQLVDDTSSRTLMTVSSHDIEGKKTEKSTEVGKRIAVRAKEAGISRVVFDRAGYRYHGRVKALADGAREGWLEF